MNPRNRIAVMLFSALLTVQLPCTAQDFSEFLAAFNSSDFKQAISTGEDFVKRYPKHAEARYYLARSYMKQGQAALAEAQLHTALSLDASEEVRNNCIAALKDISQANASASTAKASRGGASAQPLSQSPSCSTTMQSNKGVSTYSLPKAKSPGAISSSVSSASRTGNSKASTSELKSQQRN